MLHLANLLTVKDRISILQAKFLFRCSDLPQDGLLTKLSSYLKTQSSYKWSQLSKSSLWQLGCNENTETMSFAAVKQKRKQFLN